MASTFLSTANTFLHSTLSSSSTCSSPSSSSSPYTTTALGCPDGKRKFRLCKALMCDSEPSSSPVILTKRGFSTCFISSLFFSLGSAKAAILEADDDEELMEKVKKDRKKRLERQGVINSSNKEKDYLQEAVFQLSKVGQAIDNNDLSAASSVLGSSTATDWVQKANIAFTKLSSSPEEKTQVEAFNSSLASLISSVTRKDIDSSKTAFVLSATALEKWSVLSGFVEQLKGL
ncbi:thylakoid lumenal 16.5 kDa protein chloroplastic [Tripterygium wilfordii]|uniref:Thylakoid lumenal 16.5 kDa protein chloroplastic n=1 Tax=Tripterygium wilfordii TaxID=458696 RepID=A0A7J7D6L8_TRIWF|nr:thylakoid lumenal 16.5 kDa protein, chloroplastic-like [Tripterygium wilfordii]KAF5741997.1 thylakoid lumenal 16.5 kDa protein chloroplastic [Tripterygium wilfordii]